MKQLGIRDLIRSNPRKPKNMSKVEYDKAVERFGELARAWATKATDSARRARMHKALDRALDGKAARDAGNEPRYRHVKLSGPSYFPEKGGPRYEVQAGGSMKRVCSSARECIAAAKEVASWHGAALTIEALQIDPKTYTSKVLFSTKGAVGAAKDATLRPV